MNRVFGRFFDSAESELFEPAAFAEQQGAPYFILDVQTHYVSSHYDPSNAEDRRKGAVSKEGLLSLRRRIRESGLNPKLGSDRGTIDDLSWQNFVKEIFLDSETVHRPDQHAARALSAGSGRAAERNGAYPR